MLCTTRHTLCLILAAATVWTGASIADIGSFLDRYDPTVGPTALMTLPAGWIADVGYDEFDDQCTAGLMKTELMNERGMMGFTVANIPGSVAHLHRNAIPAFKFHWLSMKGEMWHWIDQVETRSVPGNNTVEAVFVWEEDGVLQRARCAGVYINQNLDKGNSERVAIAIETPGLSELANDAERRAMLKLSDFQRILAADEVRVRIASKTVFILDSADLATISVFLSELGKGWEG